MFWAAPLFQDAVGGEVKGEWKKMLWYGQQKDISEAQRSYLSCPNTLLVQGLLSPAKSLPPDPYLSNWKDRKEFRLLPVPAGITSLLCSWKFQALIHKHRWVGKNKGHRAYPPVSFLLSVPSWQHLRPFSVASTPLAISIFMQMLVRLEREILKE